MYFDCHTHTENSPDSQCRIDDLCLSAIQKGINGISITDHADTPEWDIFNIPERISSSNQQTLEAAEKYSGKLEIFTGIELGEAHIHPALAAEILSKYNFDIVLGSLHLLKSGQDFCGSNFSGFSYDELKKLLSDYYEEMYSMIQLCDFDVLTHLTYPLRYINGVYKKNLDILIYKDIIYEIFKLLCRKDIALELNTSGSITDWKMFMPDKKLLNMYKETGGELITLGSDAHKAQNAAAGFDLAAALLSECGFKNCYFYKGRKPKAVRL